MSLEVPQNLRIAGCWGCYHESCRHCCCHDCCPPLLPPLPPLLLPTLQERAITAHGTPGLWGDTRIASFTCGLASGLAAKLVRAEWGCADTPGRTTSLREELSLLVAHDRCTHAYHADHTSSSAYNVDHSNGVPFATWLCMHDYR